MLLRPLTHMFVVHIYSDSDTVTSLTWMHLVMVSIQWSSVSINTCQIHIAHQRLLGYINICYELGIQSVKMCKEAVNFHTQVTECNDLSWTRRCNGWWMFSLDIGSQRSGSVASTNNHYFNINVECLMARVICENELKGWQFETRIQLVWFTNIYI